MYKTANTIRMLQILYSGKIVKKRDLAAELETNERNIREYKRELIMAGYDIIEHKGRNGGLELDRASIIPASHLTGTECMAVLEGRNLVHAHADFALMPDFDAAFDKLFSSAVGPDQGEETTLYLSRRRQDPVEGILVELELCRQAIREHRRLSLKYRRRDGTRSEYIVEPYRIFYYEDAYYLFADKTGASGSGSGTWRFFRFSPTRMEEVQILEERFSPFSDFNLEKHLADHGFVKTPAATYTVRVREEADHLFRELDWGDDLTNLNHEKGWIRYSFTRDEKAGLFRQLLQFGPDVVLETPDSARQELAEKLDAIRENYL